MNESINELQPSFGGDSCFNVVDSYYLIGGITMDQASKIRLERKNSMLKLAELLDSTGKS